MKSLDVLCIGELNLDIFCDALEDLPEPGSFVLLDHICMYPGGCPTNTAIVTSKYQLRTGLNSLVGNDTIGRFILAELEREGVVTEYLKTIDGGETGKTVILISRTKDRVLLHHTGINSEFSLESVDLAAVRDSRAVLISSYISGLPNLRNEAATVIFKEAKASGAMTFLDMLVDPHEEDPQQYLQGVLDYTDYIILNNIEGRLVTGLEEFSQQAERLLSIGANNVIIKLGKEGSFFMNRDTSFHIEPYCVAAIDPTGSGDSFNGAFIYGCLQDWDEKKTLRFANIVGASAVTQIGCTCGVFDLQEVKAIMEEGDER